MDGHAITPVPHSYLAAGTTRMTTTRPLGMPLGAGFTAIHLVSHPNRRLRVHLANTRFTITLHHPHNS
jgi:hypothetical protein